MSGDRFVLLAVAHARSAWIGGLARLVTAGALPAELVTCVSLVEARARLAGGRPFSALLVDGLLPGLDRDLLDTAVTHGCTPIVVGGADRDWMALGAGAVLAAGFGRDELLEVLRRSARPVRRGDLPPQPADPAGEPAAEGRLIAVTGPGGTGRSTLAAGLAQALSADAEVVLADFALHAGQAALHGTADVLPGLPELVEAHRTGWPGPAELRALTWDVPARGYHLLLGLRRHRDWATLRARAVTAGLGGLRRAYGHVVIDVDDDVEGHDTTGSVEVEERNVLARTVLSGADAVVVAGVPGLAGVHALTRCLRGLIEFGVRPERLVPVVNLAPRGPRRRAEITAAVAALTQAAVGRPGDLAPPVFVPAHRGVEEAHRDAARLPDRLGAVVRRAVTAALERVGGTVEQPAPELVRPGSLGSWGVPA